MQFENGFEKGTRAERDERGNVVSQTRERAGKREEKATERQMMGIDPKQERETEMRGEGSWDNKPGAGGVVSSLISIGLEIPWCS